MTVSEESGLYVVLLHSAELVPVTRDSRYVADCAKVNAHNVKLGKASNFRLRASDYIRDFDADAHVFIPIAATADVDRAETAAFRALDAHRKRSPKGARMDWLESISKDEVIALVFDALDRQEIVYRCLV